jgi:hypothetical protein
MNKSSQELLDFFTELYIISVKEEKVEGETLYIARVEGFPDVEEYGESSMEARQLAIETIITAQELCLEENIPFREYTNYGDPICNSFSVSETTTLPEGTARELLQVEVDKYK